MKNKVVDINYYKRKPFFKTPVNIPLSNLAVDMQSSTYYNDINKNLDRISLEHEGASDMKTQTQYNTIVKDFVANLYNFLQYAPNELKQSLKTDFITFATNNTTNETNSLNEFIIDWAETIAIYSDKTNIEDIASATKEIKEGNYSIWTPTMFTE